MKACRGIGASLTEEEISMWEQEHKKLLAEVAPAEFEDSIKTRIFAATVIFVLGICLGTFSKFLDYRQAELPALIQAIDQALDFHNFLGGFAPWIIIAICISVYSHTAVRAAVNVFLFF